jgi:hypothetical protein
VCHNRYMFRLKVLLLASAMMPAALLAQTAQISGLILDSSQARIPGARIEITNVTTGTSRSTVANAEGLYTLALLPPGNYTLKVEANGFRSLSQSNVVLEVEQSARLDLTLQLGATSDSVQVTDTMPLLQAGNASLGQVIESKSLPICR